LIPDDQLRAAVDTAERFADGLADKNELAATRAAVAESRSDAGPFGHSPEGTRVAVHMAVAATEPLAASAAFDMTTCSPPLAGRVVEAEAGLYFCSLFRCIFGNPFRPVTFAPDWRSASAVALAAGMYEARDFSHLPVLADALEEAGCDHPDVLAHCRGPGPHARGCWVVDLVLGKG
jgi:hypothetical protein